MNVKARLLCRKDSNQGAIMLVAYFDTQQKEMSLGRKIPKDDWDAINGMAKGSQYKMLNVVIRNAIRNISSEIDRLTATGETVDLNAVFNTVFKKVEAPEPDVLVVVPLTLIEFIKMFIAENPDKIKDSTMNSYRTLIASINDFRPGAKLSAVDVSFVNQLYDHFKAEGLTTSTIQTRFAKLKKIINTAISRNLITQFPFGKGKLSVPTAKGSKRKYLTEQEISTLTSYKPVNESEKKVMEIVLFNLHAGLRIGDVFTLRKSNIIESVDPVKGTTYRLTRTTAKTESNVNILLTKQASEVILNNGYAEKSDDDLIFPWLNENDFKTEFGLYRAISAKTAYFNKVLYMICAKAGVKVISSHSLRHTFCTSLITKGVPVTSISKLVGHSDINTTMIYSQVIQETADEAILALEIVTKVHIGIRKPGGV